MTLASAVAEGRAAAAGLMLDSCVIRASGGGQATDPVTGVVTETPGAVRYTGPCRVQVEAQSVEQDDAGERRYQLLNAVVSVPVDATRYEQGDLVLVTGSALDPALVGKRYRVRTAVAKTNLTARRLHCEEGV